MLPTTLVVALLMAVAVMGLLSLYQTDLLFFARANYIRDQRDNIASMFVLYRLDPAIAKDTTYQLYDTLPSSRMSILRREWGLYEVVTVASERGDLHRSCIMGLACAAPGKGGSGGAKALWYNDNNNALTLTGNSNIENEAWLPRGGVIYGQMQSVFFTGNKLMPAQIHQSEAVLPKPTLQSCAAIDRLLRAQPDTPFTESLTRSFYRRQAAVMWVDGNLAGCAFAGNVILTGDRVHVDRSTHLTGVVIAARRVSIGDGFKGSVQIFARDTALVGEGVHLKAPSGVYARSYVELGEGSLLEGYMIVDFDGKVDRRKPNCRKARTSRLRGLLYARGITQLQGITVGSAYVEKATYYSSHGYYEDMLYDASIVGSEQVVYPLWLDERSERKEAAVMSYEL
ncbi:hypothetical protein FACS1894159_09830 [Bacteroidia bacterium]|nr:hypothetical protein FACS1894159_09830 [Bacteroidia bacterium]